MQSAQEVWGVSLYSFSGTVGADNESEGPEEGDDVFVFGVEAPDALYQHFVDSTHLFRLLSLQRPMAQRCMYVYS